MIRGPPEQRDEAGLVLAQIASLKGYEGCDHENEEQAQARVKAARALLLAALEDADEPTRNAATQSIAYVSVEIVPGLVAALERKNPLVSLHATTALGKMGPEARAALGSVPERLVDPEETIRIAAELAINAIEKPEQ